MSFILIFILLIFITIDIYPYFSCYKGFEKMKIISHLLMCCSERVITASMKGEQLSE